MRLVKLCVRCMITVLVLIPCAFTQELVTSSIARSPQAHTPQAVPGGYIVSFAPGSSRSARASAALQAGAAARFNYHGVAAMAVTIPNEQALNALRRNSAVSGVVPDFIVGAAVKGGNGKGGGKPGDGDPGTATPLDFDTRQLVSYAVQRVGIPVTGSDGTGIGIAVLDSGIDYNHPDLAPSASAFNAVNPGASCQDDAGHGTHVAGLIGAANNDVGIVGIAPAAELYCVKVLDNNALGSDSTLMAGLDWVLQNHNLVDPPIRVVNMSLGRTLGTGETIENSVLRPHIQALREAGIVVVASAGNEESMEISDVVPAGFPELMAVSSTVATTGIRTCLLFSDPRLSYVPADTASGFTTDGPDVAIAAPGEERTDIVYLGSSGCVGLQYGILSTTLGTGGATRKLPSGDEARGTSFAAPLVAGVAARVLQKQLVPGVGDSAQVDGIRTWIQQNASRVDEAPLDHPWANLIYEYTFDGVREGIAQAPK